MGTEFKLDDRLSQESIEVMDLPLCRVLLSDTNDFTWLILVPRRAELVEITDLSSDDQTQLWHEITFMTKLLKNKVAAYKVNVAALGNVVRQLHVHVIARFEGDKAWPGVVWGKERHSYTKEERDTKITALRQWILEGVDHV